MPSEDLQRDATDVGDFAALFTQLDGATATHVVDSGYATLFSRLNSADYRRRCGLTPN